MLPINYLPLIQLRWQELAASTSVVGLKRKSGVQFVK